ENLNNQLTVTVVRVEGDLDERWVKVKAINAGKDDFESGEAALIFKKGERRLSKIFHVTDDNTPETNRTLTFRLFPFGSANVQGILGNPTEFNVTILENDDANGIIVFANTSLSIAESKSDRKSVSFVLERRRGLFGDVSVSWNVTSGTDALLDISPTSGKVQFKELEKFKILEIFSVEDEIPELDENFTINLTQVEGGAKIGHPREAQLTIVRNDDAIEFAAPAHVRVDEGERATFTILRHGRTDEAIHVSYTTEDGSAMSSDRDYNPITQQILFANGETQKSISVYISDDDKPESDENFTIVLTSSTGDTSIYGNTVAVVTIAASDDPNGIFHFDGNSDLNKTANERGTVSFKVVRDRGFFGSVGVLWQIYQVFSNGSRHALKSGDFDQTSGALVFQDREQTKDLVLSVSSDDLAEYGESFEVVLENVTGGSPGPGGKLSSNLTVAYIHIPTNDNPYGLFAFAHDSLDVSVAEDTKPGYEYKATANLTVVRKRGKDRDVGVSTG
ncbi:G- coupled receptor 98, partial [Paramuricea clavata]